MKNLRLLLFVSLVAFVANFSIAAADSESYDSETATIQKAGEHTAKSNRWIEDLHRPDYVRRWCHLGHGEGSL